MERAMTSEEKLLILEKLIERANNASYDSKLNMTSCEDDAMSFIRNVLSKDCIETWIKRINNIHWSLSVFSSNTPDYKFVSAWDRGKQEFISVLESIKSEIMLYDKTQSDNTQKVITDKVFIVHGHNETMKLSVARTIEQLGLTPVILHEQPNKGRTVIEKFEKLSENVCFAIVLLSAEDELNNGKWRARQNVILELGYFIAKLGRENVIALYDTASSDIDIPSDISGILYEPYDSTSGAWRIEVVQELKAAGFNVDANSLIEK